MLTLFIWQVQKVSSDRATRTLPDNLDIKFSSILNAGYGVWTKAAIVVNSVFGPYEGEIVDSEVAAHNFGYSFGVSVDFIIEQIYLIH